MSKNGSGMRFREMQAQVLDVVKNLTDSLIFLIIRNIDGFPVLCQFYSLEIGYETILLLVFI